MTSIYSLEDKPELITQLREFLNLSLERDSISKDLFNRVFLEDSNQEPKYILFLIDNEDLVGVLIGAEIF